MAKLPETEKDGEYGTMTRNGTRGFSDQNNHFVKVPEVPKSVGYHRKAMLVC